MKSDGELLRLYYETHSDAAFSELVRRHLNLVYAAALRRLHGDSHAAADVAQAVFATLARKAAALAGHPALSAWLYSTTRNIAIDHIRNEARRLRHEKEAETMMTSHSSTCLPVETLAPLLDSAMDRLGEQDRQVIILRFFGNKAFAEIAATLRISEDAARMRVNRALEKLRHQLARQGLRSSAAALGLALAGTTATAAPAELTATVAAIGAGTTPQTATLSSISLMISTHKAAIGTGLALVLVTATAFHQHGTLRTAQAGIHRQTRQLEELRQAHASASEANRQITDEIASAKPRPGNAPENSSASPEKGRNTTERTGADRPAGIRSTIHSLNKEIEQEKVRLHFTSEWREIAIRGVPFLNRLKLSPEQIRQYMALTAEELQCERFDAWFSSGNTIESYPAQLRKEWAARAGGILGAENFEQLARYLRAQTSISELAGYTQLFDMPLSSAQETRLLDLLSEAPAAAKRDDRYWQEVELRAETILSTPQLAAWRRLRSLSKYQAELIQSYNRSTAAPADIAH